MWRFRCDCGKEVTRRATSVRQGLTKSCGCLRLRNLRPRQDIPSSQELLNPRKLHPIVHELIKARVAKKITQEKLAKLSGWSYGGITNMELGRVNPRLGMISDIATVLGLTLTLGNSDG
ncbi:MAG: helix-turn-helix transcriptional regulator [Sulfurovaceae bacterium]|nr:helix-turn-helix transcriptional regulator [Sulfurovaceae bacterium]